MLAATLAVAAGCATLEPLPSSREATPAEREHARRTIVAPYLACMRTEGGRLGGSAVAADGAELRCGRYIQELRAYGAATDIDALRWSDWIEQVRGEGRRAAAAAR